MAHTDGKKPVYRPGLGRRKRLDLCRRLIANENSWRGGYELTGEAGDELFRLLDLEPRCLGAIPESSASECEIKIYAGDLYPRGGGGSGATCAVGGDGSGGAGVTTAGDSLPRGGGGLGFGPART
jgi:hypothetical protein